MGRQRRASDALSKLRDVKVEASPVIQALRDLLIAETPPVATTTATAKPAT